MQNFFSGGSAARWFFASALTLAVSFAVETRFWQQSGQADFEKGTSRKLSSRSDGRLMLAPTLTEVFDSPSPYLWAAVVDSSSTVYAAGGGSGSGAATLFAIGRDGKSRTVAELQGLEIHALAVDRSNRVYAATDPDGKVYRIGAGGKPELFYDPHTKYIWALAFNRQGDLFVATGDPGDIHRVTPDGKGSVFFKTEEAHARSLAIDADGNLIVGTEPGGLVVRVSASGQGFVLYQTSKREVTAVAVSANGDIYASASGNKTPPAQPIVVPTPQPPIAPPAASGNPNATFQPPVAPPPSFTPFGVGTPIAGGSEVYRIDHDGAPRKLWSNAQDIVYAIAFDAAGHPLLGTGNHGRIYRLDSDVMHTLLVDTSPTQITGFAPGPQGSLYAVTGNIGRLYRIGPDLEKTGTFESDVFDAGSFAWWGRLALHGTTAGVAVSTRSGNLNRPQNNWSAWSPLQPGGRVASPPARFLQYKLELSAAAAVTEVEVAWLAKNFPPVIEEIEVAPPNYKFPANSLGVTAPSTSITLPPMGQHRKNSSPSSSDLGSQTVNYAKGSLGARWSATDENGDTLTYKVEIRGVNEADWKPLKDKLRERYVSWDSTGFPDGEYMLRVTASDAPSNPPGQALSATLVSDPFTIDNTPPSISVLTGTRQNGRIEVRWTARDALSKIEKAEYSVDGGDWLIIEPVTKLSDSPLEEYRLVIDASAGEHVIAVRVSDECDNQAVDKVVVK
jgi:WD40 repeat protein